MDKIRRPDRVVNCPGCKTKLRVPVKNGSTLRITCPRCTVLFDLSFTNPFKEIFKWDKSLSFFLNIKGFKARFLSLPAKDRFSVAIFFISILLFLSIMVTSSLYTDKKTTQDVLPEENDHQLKLSL